MVLAAVFMLISVLTTSWTDGVFPDSQATLTSPYPESEIMKVFMTDDPGDLEILRSVCDAVDEGIIASPEFKRLMAGMLATVNDPGNMGVGIAAPQVGITKRIIAVQRFDQEGEPFGFYLNPKIVSASGEMVESQEGCLSVSDKRGCVLRHAAITVEYNHPEDFRLCREDIEGFTAIIFQHETDHLNGILFTDKIITTTPDGEI